MWLLVSVLCRRMLRPVSLSARASKRVVQPPQPRRRQQGQARNNRSGRALQVAARCVNRYLAATMF